MIIVLYIEDLILLVRKFKKDFHHEGFRNNAAIQIKIFGSGMTALIISIEEIKSLEESGFIDERC